MRRMSSYIDEKAEIDRIADVVCADLTAEERQRIRDRLLVKFFDGQPVHFWRLPVAQNDRDVTNRVSAKIGGYVLDIPDDYSTRTH
jgi:hypothetical protein